MKYEVIFFLFVLSLGSVFAISGVSPASYEINFEPNFSGEFSFDFFVEKGVESLCAEGDLAEYVSFDKDSVSGREDVVVFLNLPSEIDKPGVNYIKIIAGKIVGGIKVLVPYPERYVEVGLNAPNVNVGEDILFELELFGRGNKSVIVSPRIGIYENGVEVDVMGIEDVEVFPDDEISVNVSMDTSDYLAGDYMAVAFLDYDNVSVSVENPFRLGEFSVELIDYTKSFREDKIDRFDILVESFWDDDMGGVYAEVNVLGFDSASFVSSSEDLDAWSQQVLTGFLDMSEIEGDSFGAEIVLYYGNESVSEIVELKVIKGFDYVFLIMIIVVVGVLGFLCWRCCIFIRRFKKHKIKK